MKLHRLIAASLLAAAFPVHAALPDAPCKDLIQVQAAMKVTGGGLLRPVTSGKADKDGVLTCSYMRQDGRMASVSLVIKRLIDVKASQNKRNITTEPISGIARSAVFYRDTPSSKKPGWSAVGVRGIKASDDEMHFVLSVQMNGGDEKAIREYLVETMKNVIAKTEEARIPLRDKKPADAS